MDLPVKVMLDIACALKEYLPDDIALRAAEIEDKEEKKAFDRKAVSIFRKP